MSEVRYLNNTEVQAAGLELSLLAARFFWSLAVRDGVYGPTVEFVDTFNDFLFEAGFYIPDGNTRPVSENYLKQRGKR